MGYYFFFYNKVTNANALLIIKDYTWNKVAKLSVLLDMGKEKMREENFIKEESKKEIS